jgi:hypothetical protein
MDTSDNKDVVKVTLYMTPLQWNILSAWNIGRMEQDVDTWLHLSHEQGGRIEDEYNTTIQNVKDAITCTVAHHTSSSGEFDSSSCVSDPANATRTE